MEAYPRRSVKSCGPATRRRYRAGLRLVNGLQSDSSRGYRASFELTNPRRARSANRGTDARKEAGAEGDLARMGVDGIIVAREFDFLLQTGL